MSIIFKAPAYLLAMRFFLHFGELIVQLSAALFTPPRIASAVRQTRSCLDIDAPLPLLHLAPVLYQVGR